MEDGHFPTGIIGALIDEKHYQAMGDALWLFAYLVHRQTKPNGLVLGGKPITDEEIGVETRIPIKTIRRMRSILRDYPYIETIRTPRGLRYRILKPKKFAYKQEQLPMEEIVSDSPEWGNHSESDYPENGNRVPQTGQSNIRQAVDLQNSKPDISTDDERPPQAIPTQPLVGFKLFWEAYPENRRIGENVAQRAWLSRVRADDRWPEVLAGLELWKKCAQWADPQFIPNIETFLKRDQWKDVPPKENQRGADQSRNRKAGDKTGAYRESGKKYRQPTVL